ncbi:MAG: 7-carboxy-7-deazaguanine synthase QueE [Candidatus Aminicenantes bacterium]
MPQPHTLNITEIFPSFQGEGLRQGEPTLFVRLSGCNLRCSFCDTKYAWEKGKDCTAQEVLTNIQKIKRRFPAEWICLTGGEPMLQDVEELVNRLKADKFKVQVETNATLYRSLPVDWYSISPKPKKYFYHPQYRKKAEEVKVIVTKNLTVEVIGKLRQEFPLSTPILLQPQSMRKWSMNLSLKLLRGSLRKGLKNIKVSVQLHKIYGFR